MSLGQARNLSKKKKVVQIEIVCEIRGGIGGRDHVHHTLPQAFGVDVIRSITPD